MRRGLLAALALVPALAAAQPTSDNILDTMRATLVHGPQKVRLEGAALAPFRALFEQAKQEVPVIGETSVVSRSSTQPPCGRVSVRLTPIGVTGKSPAGGKVEQVYWDVAYNLCADSSSPSPDALARGAARPGATVNPAGVGLTR